MASDTKNTIIKSALELFAGNGYHKTSMDSIASKAGISKGTLYWHFSSKKELFQELITDGFDQLYNQTRRILNQEITAEQMIYRLVEVKVKFFTDHRDISRIIINNTELINREFKKKMMDKHRKMVELVAGIMEKGIQEELFKKQNPEDMAVLLLSMSNCVNSRFIFSDVQKREDKVEFIYNIIMNGIKREG